MLIPLTEKEFDRAYPILADSFPADEIRPYGLQKALLKDPGYRLYGLEQDGKIKGLIAVYELEKLTFVEHLAVSAQCRNQGLGGQLLGELMAATDKMVCLEVEHPTTELARRRIRFYQRNGLHLNDYPYTQPPLAPGQQSVELLIMTAGRTVSYAEFDEIRLLLYTRVYHWDAC